MAVQICNPSSRETEAGASRVPGQSGLHTEGLAFKNIKRTEVGEMAQWLKVLVARLEVPGPVPSIHMAAHSCL